jgi:hypothetical protein
MKKRLLGLVLLLVLGTAVAPAMRDGGDPPPDCAPGAPPPCKP